MPSAATMALAFREAAHHARGGGMPGMKTGMMLGEQARALADLAASDYATQLASENKP